VKQAASSIQLLPQRSVVVLQECDAALRVLPVKKEGTMPYVPQQKIADGQSQMKEFIE